MLFIIILSILALTAWSVYSFFWLKNIIDDKQRDSIYIISPQFPSKDFKKVWSRDEVIVDRTHVWIEHEQYDGDVVILVLWAEASNLILLKGEHWVNIPNVDANYDVTGSEVFDHKGTTLRRLYLKKSVS
jgi:hypothetical protein